MTATKQRISVTILPQIVQMLDEISKTKGMSKSALVEKALSRFFENQMAIDMEKLAHIKFDDLPTEDDWLGVQSEI